MADFNIAKLFTSDLEGGFWNDPSAGWTYAGITYKYFPEWNGWPYLKQLAIKKFGDINDVPRYTKFSDTRLDKLVSDFYKKNHWGVYAKGDLIKNQDIANLVYDFIVHKQNDAINVINKVATFLNKKAVTKKDQLSSDVVKTFNASPVAAYSLLKKQRTEYYRTGPFSAKMKKAFIDRVEKFPVSTKGPVKSVLDAFNFFWQ